MKGIRALLVLLVVGAVLTAVALELRHPATHAIDRSRRSRQRISRPSRRQLGHGTRRHLQPAVLVAGHDQQGERERSSRSPGTRASPIPTKGKPNFTGAFAEAEPVVYGGTMYMPDTKGNVFAFDAVTGERLWYYKPKYPKGFASGLPTSRGVVIGDGKVFMAQTDGNIVGLDQSTGRVAWKTNVGDYKQGYFFTSPPTYINGMLIIGQSGGDFGARCKVARARRARPARSSGRST